ncbi:MAG: hypothetical protein J5663_01895 [Bacteroidaceae bacterium]|nr:hypothetical protein [Bacteroidaceae bacterium]
MKTNKIIIVLCAGILAHMTGCKTETELIGTIGKPVDLGLSVLWADHNLGGECVTDSGISLPMETKGKKKVVDTAKLMWGGGWHSPTIAQMQELIDECDWRSTKQDGVEGYIVTGPNGNTIFVRRFANESMDYWTSEIDKEHKPFIGIMYMNNAYVSMSYSEKFIHKFIRPVMRNKQYRKIEEKDRVRDTLLLKERVRNAEARKVLEAKLADANAATRKSSKMFTKAKKEGTRVMPYLQLDTAKVINFTLAELDKLDNVFYRFNDLNDGYVCFTGEQDLVTMRFKGLLAFTLDLDMTDDNASVSLNYNNGNRFKSDYIHAKKGVSTNEKVYYADKDSVTTISLSSWHGGRVTLKRIRLFHSLTLEEE